jgi:hypothetical protein
MVMWKIHGLLPQNNAPQPSALFQILILAVTRENVLLKGIDDTTKRRVIIVKSVLLHQRRCGNSTIEVKE